MSWATTSQVGQFLSAAHEFMSADPVANTVLLTEAGFWSRLTHPPAGARFGWWTHEEQVQAAFVHLPDHWPICSPLPAASVAALPAALGLVAAMGVDAGDAANVAAAWSSGHRESLRAERRMTLLRLGTLTAPQSLAGAARVADETDLPLLRTWFGLFRRQHPDDPSHMEFVVDQPLQDGGVIVWEVDDQAVAMASRTVQVAGMVRMGLSFQPSPGAEYADAAFVAACTAARQTAEHVLVLSASPEATNAYRSLGFAPVLDRVVLAATDRR